MVGFGSCFSPKQPKRAGLEKRTRLRSRNLTSPRLAKLLTRRRGPRRTHAVSVRVGSWGESEALQCREVDTREVFKDESSNPPCFLIRGKR